MSDTTNTPTETSKQEASTKGSMKSLAKDTAIYGISNILSRFLNFLLVPLYTYVLKQTSDYGIVTNLYAWTALLLVILTYGMETGFFRFANNEEKNPASVYTTTIISLFVTSLLFAVCCVVFRHPIADALTYPDHSEFIAMMGVVVSMDAFACIPFAYLRYKKRPLRFAILKFVYVLLNIIFNLFFLILCPKIQDWSIISCWYNPDYGVGWVFVSNILATSLQTLCLLPHILDARKGSYSWPLLKEMLRYSLPLLVLGIAGIMNQTLDRIIFPYLWSGSFYDFMASTFHLSDAYTHSALEAQELLGIYGACFKVAMVMMIFTQAFRYAYEPFVFSKHKDRQSVAAYADATKYYILFSFLIMLVVIFYLDIFKFIIGRAYWSGLSIVPIVLWTYIFQGVYFNLSFWYKLTDRTQYGMWFSLLGLFITTLLQVIFVPVIGYYASAASSTVCFFIIMLLSYFVGKKYLEIPYDLKRIGAYTGLTIVLLALYYGFAALLKGVNHATIYNMLFGSVLLLGYCAVLVKYDFPLSGLPVVGKYFKKK